MNRQNPCRVACIGSGGVATSLLQALYHAGYSITQVYSRHLKNAAALAHKVEAEAIDNLQHYRDDADVVIVALPDDTIESVLPCFAAGKALIVHTCGSLAMQVFEHQGIAHYGVLYPLQTLSRQRVVDMRDVPIFVEANTPANTIFLQSLAGYISKNVSEMSSEKRLQLHLAAVFACNFTNHLWSIATDILQNNKLSPALLRPLISETLAKATAAKHPQEVQTGPAYRGDKKIMQKHIKLLNNNELQQKIYALLSDSIQRSAINFAKFRFFATFAV
ncbi:hypothetical protein AGMMS4956_04930 [Bacteroidia bacterium]|nr:hypothetical protein AGMMS4956_04930 [Bacteroidia bacterium]